MKKIILIVLLLALTCVLYSQDNGKSILLLYQSSMGETLINSHSKRVLAPILREMDFKVGYLDVDGPLPLLDIVEEYYAVIGWLSSNANSKPLDLISWYEGILKTSTRLILLESIGCWQNSETKEYISDLDLNRLFTRLGVFCKGEWTDQMELLQIIYADNEIFYNGYEISNETNYFLFEPLSDQVNQHLILSRTDMENSESTMVFTSPKGGFVFYDYLQRNNKLLIDIRNFINKALFTQTVENYNESIEENTEKYIDEDELPHKFTSRTSIHSDGEIKKRYYPEEDSDINGRIYNQSFLGIKEQLAVNLNLHKNIFLGFMLDVQNRGTKLDFGYKNEDYTYADNNRSDDTYKLVSGFANLLRYNNLTYKNRFGVNLYKPGLTFSVDAGFDFFCGFQVQHLENTPRREDSSDNLPSLEEKTYYPMNDYFDQVIFYPTFAFMLGFHKIEYFGFDFTYSYQLEKTSVIPWINGYYFSQNTYIHSLDFYHGMIHRFLVAQEFGFNLSYNFGFAKVYPLTNIYFSNYFSFKYYTISDFSGGLVGNTFPFTYYIDQFIDYKAVSLNKAGFDFHVLFKTYYEGSQQDFEPISNVSIIEDNIYDSINSDDIFLKMYSPHQILGVRGGMKFRVDLRETAKAPVIMTMTTWGGTQWKHLFNHPVIDDESVREQRDYTVPFVDFAINFLVEVPLRRITFNFEFDYFVSFDVYVMSYNPARDEETWQSIEGSIFVEVPFGK